VAFDVSDIGKEREFFEEGFNSSKDIILRVQG
jgi:hypothetical protein